MDRNEGDYHGREKGIHTNCEQDQGDWPCMVMCLGSSGREWSVPGVQMVAGVLSVGGCGCRCQREARVWPLIEVELDGNRPGEVSTGVLCLFSLRHALEPKRVLWEDGGRLSRSTLELKPLRSARAVSENLISAAKIFRLTMFWEARADPGRQRRRCRSSPH
jgi:hypothetical protein